MKVLTEALLRESVEVKSGLLEYVVSSDVIVTAAAKDYLSALGIALKIADNDDISSKNEDKQLRQKDMPDMEEYIEYTTGRVLKKKPEHLTHLFGNTLVEKTHPRIILRGKLDSLLAYIIDVQIEAREANDNAMFDYLNEFVNVIHKMLYAEVLNKPLELTHIIGLNVEELREMSHHPKKFFGCDHIFTDASMPKMVVKLNILRTEIRQAEIALAIAFGEERSDLNRVINRMSSAIYILMCMYYSGKESLK